MSESAALARALAAQLGDDLDRILGSEPDEEAPSFEMADTPATALELRQVAGLSAGFTQILPPGEHHFGTDSGSVAGDERTRPFTITIDDDLTAWISTDAHVRLDGQFVKKPTAVGRAVIDAGSARFVVSPSLPPIRRRNGSGARFDVTTQQKPSTERIRIADYQDAEPPPVAKKRRFGLRSSDTPVDLESEPLMKRIYEIRQKSVDYERSLFPDLGQLKQMATAGSDHIGHVEFGDEFFGRVPIAYGDLEWKPPVDRPDRIPRHLVAVVQRDSILPSVPLTADLSNGHLGIIGPRDACMAVVRQIAVTLRVLSPVNQISFTLLRSEGARPDWEWLDQLPADDGTGLPVMFFDGMRQVSHQGMRQSLVEEGTGGAIIIDDQVRDIPSICSNVLEIYPSGAAALMDFRLGATTTRVASPLGFDLATTMEFAQHLRS